MNKTIRMIIFSSLTLTTILGSQSCSKKLVPKGKSAVNINVKGREFLSIANGGIYITARKTDDTEFIGKNGSRAGGDIFEVKNGSWEFAVYAWTGSTSLNGPLKCGSITREFTGGEIDLSITVNSNCSDRFTGGTNYKTSSNQPKPLRIVSCSTNSTLSNVGVNDCNLNQGSARSFKVSVLEFEKKSTLLISNSYPITSECISFSNTNYAATTIALPVLSSGLRMPFKATTYTDENCTTSLGEFSNNEGLYYWGLTTSSGTSSNAQAKLKYSTDYTLAVFMDELAALGEKSRIIHKNINSRKINLTNSAGTKYLDVTISGDNIEKVLTNPSGTKELHLWTADK